MNLDTKNNSTALSAVYFVRTIALTFLLCITFSVHSEIRQTLDDKDCRNPHGSYECLIDSLWQKTTRWLNTWAEHDTAAYFKFYAPQLSPVKNVSYKQWRGQRAQRVGRDRTLKLGVNFLDAEVIEGRKVRVLFIQRYDSGSYADIVLKTLVYQLIQGEFLIVEEISHQTLSDQDAQTILDNIK